VKDKERVCARAKAFVERRVRERLAPLFSLVDGKLEGAARGLAYQLGTSLGALSRREVQGLVDALSPEDRRRLQGRGVRLGWAHVYMPSLLKPATIEVCAALHHAQHHGHDGAAQPWPLPPPGAVSFPVEASVPAAHWFACGFVVIGAHAYRLDMLDKVAIEVRALLRDGPVIPPPSVLSWLGAPATALDEILLWCGLVPNGQGRYVAQPRAHERRAERAAPRKRRAPRAPASTLGTLGDVMRAAGQRAKGPS
jgi:ATP-dependent RNA helicase SUPV3L1/SUV3